MEEIKVGDTVLVQKSISYGWNKALYFWCAEKVARVTPAQFEVCGNKYRKKDGSLVGEAHTHAYLPGAIPRAFDSMDREPLKDQSEEYRATMANFQKLALVRKKMEEVNACDVRDLISNPEALDNLLTALKEMNPPR